MEEEEQNEQEEDEEIDMDNESMELTNTEQACCGSECGLPEATEMETNAAGGSVVLGCKKLNH